MDNAFPYTLIRIDPDKADLVNLFDPEAKFISRSVVSLETVDGGMGLDLFCRFLSHASIAHEVLQ